jgi:succinoglycan biosynthesis transport protein ExoP
MTEGQQIIFNINVLKGFFRRRKHLFLAVASLGCLITILLALFLPRVYVSKSTILIEQKLSPEYIKTVSPGSVEERLQTIRQQILSREKLQEIINQFNLYPGMRDLSEKENVIKNMQEDIVLKTISGDEITGRSRGRLDTVAFTLSYEARDPVIAQKVASILTSAFLEKNLQSREQRATKTEAVLQQTAEQMKTQMDGYAKKLNDFMSAHAGELPETKSFNSEQISRLSTSLDQIDTNSRILQDRRVYLQGQLSAIDPGAGKGADSASANPRIRLQGLRKEQANLRMKYSEKHPDVVRIKRQIQDLETQLSASEDYNKKSAKLEESNSKLTSLKASLGPNHPDVVKLSDEVSALSRELASKKSERPTVVSVDSDVDNPAYANLKTQLATTEMEIKNLAEQKSETRRRIESYSRKNERATIIEPEYKKLSQDFENAQKKYTEIMNKLMEAKMAKGVEETQQIEQFTIIEQAHVPEKPEKPKLPVIFLVGFFLSFASGIFASVIRENFDHSVKSVDELQKLTRLPVLSVLPYILNEEEEERKIKSNDFRDRWIHRKDEVLRHFFRSQANMKK